MNQGINADFTGLELRIQAHLAGGVPKGRLAIITARPDPRGRSKVAADFIVGIKRDPLEAPNATSIRTIKPRQPALSIIDGKTHGAYWYDVPYTHRIQGGMQ